MSKKKTTKKKTRVASAAARKPTKSRSSRAVRGPAAPRKPGPVRLKPILVLIGQAIEALRRLPPTDSTEMAIKQLEIARMAIDDVCNRPAPDGCGPTMEFPPPPAA